MKKLEKYETAVEFIKDLPDFMIWWSFSLKKRWIITRKPQDIDVIVPAYFWQEFKEMEYLDDFHTNRYWDILPQWIFIYTYEFPDWSIDLIFRKDYNSLEYERVNWYKHISINEILKQKEHLLSNWNWDCESKHEEDIKLIKKYLK
jgi:hypothetical protein